MTCHSRQRPQVGRLLCFSKVSTTLAVLQLVVFLSGGVVQAASSSTAGGSTFPWIPQTVVSNYLNLALDVKQMRTTNNITEKLRIYQQGNHSSISLASLSLSAGQNWKDVPMYKIYLDAFLNVGVTRENDPTGLFDGSPAEQYADTLVRDLCKLNIPRIEGTGAVILNVLMSYWGYLWQMLQACRINDVKNMTAALDTAFALWTGADQIRNDKQRGYLLYSQTEFVGALFGQQDTLDTIVNSEVILLLTALKSNINSGICKDPETGYVFMRNRVRLLIQYSNTMLVQNLLYYIQDVLDGSNSSEFVELYSLALNPQVAACDSGLYTNLLDLTVDRNLTADNRAAAISAVQSSLSCLGLTCEDVGAYSAGNIPMCMDQDGSQAPVPFLAHYQPSTDVRDLSYVDRDSRQIRIFMKLGSWSSAYDYYKYGWHSDRTLKQLAMNSQQSSDFTLFQDYYKTSSTYGFADQLISAALQGTAPFDVSSVEERMGVVGGTLESSIMYFGVTGELSAAITACNQGNKTRASQHWDSAAALLIGSTEGESSGGQHGGQSLYAISKEFCAAFGNCESFSSVVDTVLLAAMQAGASAIRVGECQQASSILEQKLRYFLLIPMFQGLLYYTVGAALQPDIADARGFLIAYTQAILPYVAIANPDGGVSIQNSIQKDATVDVLATFNAVRIALPKMGVDCSEIGQLAINGKPTGVCASDAPPLLPAPTVPVAPTAPTQAPSLAPVYIPKPDQGGLAWGRYKFVNTTVAEMDSLFTLDVRDMWLSGTPDKAKSIYLNPSTNAIGGLSGHPEIHTLQDFSTKASTFMNEDPVYNFFRVALFDDESFDLNVTDSASGWPFADAVEQLAIGPSNGNSAQLGSKAVIVMNIWMMIAHQLYEAVRSCDQSKNTPELIDSAVALWIGQEQGEGKFNSGWSMYSIAQEAIELYGVKEREAQVNMNLMGQFVIAQNLTQSCSSDQSSAMKLRALIDDIIRNLSIPLLQHLFFHMSSNDFAYVELYALAFVPQTISVDEGSFAYLRDALFQGFSWSVTIAPNFQSAFGKVLQAMRFTCDDLGDTTAANKNLKGLVQVFCHEINAASTFLAAYQTSFDVSEIARIDLDVLQMDLFLRAKAYDLAFSVYENGRNSRAANGGFLTLKGLATSKSNSTAGDLQASYENFFNKTSYADSIITQAVTPASRANGTYAGFSRRQLSESVRRTLQSMVVYVQVVSQLHSAIDVCKVSKSNVTNSTVANAGQQNVDQAVALYIGSIEGPFSGGSTFGTGQLIYALAKEMCPYFNKCESQGDSDVNIYILFALSNMKESLDAADCSSAESILKESILSVLPVPLVQGILFFADENEGISSQATNTSLVAGDILTESLLPQIAEVNKSSASIIFNNMDFDFEKTAVVDGAETVFKAVSSVLRGIGIDCESVGSLVSHNISVCDAQAGPKPNTTTNLGNNLYVATTYVQDRSNIALDIKEMGQALSLGYLKVAESIYTDGKNSEIYNKQGIEIGLRALATFSTDASLKMKNNPVYQVAVYALRDENGQYLGTNASQYADSVVREMLIKGAASKTPLAAEAAVALNLWMELANELFDTVANCKNQTLTDDDGIHSIDEAAAYWIGDGQIAGDSEKGHLLYALAEKMGDYFNINTAGQSRTNINILRLFYHAKMEVSLANACVNNQDTAARVRHIVDQIVSLMVVVNVQALIHYLLVSNERDRVRIYAHAFVPLVAGCNPLAFTYLKAKLLDGPYSEVDVGNITSTIRTTFPCFSIKCDDIGIHSSEAPSACSDPNPLSPLAGYRPANDISEYSKLDLDILELDILMQMQAYDAAQDLYSYGKHATMGAIADGTALSLADLATTSGRSVVPEFDAFKRYYGNNGKYADTMVQGALVQSSTMTATQRRVVVTGASQYMIMYMAALQAMHEAIGTCVSSGTDRGSSSAKSWDRVAALIIGHLEGINDGGSTQGLLLWALSKKYCNEFGTCSKYNGVATMTNDKIATLLYSGRGAVLSGSCDELRKATNSLAPLLLVPLLQASLSSTITLAQGSSKDTELIQAEAYVYAQALLPLIANIDQSSADTIKTNFPLQGQAIRDGVKTVASAFTKVIAGLNVKCEDIGSNSEINSCTGEVNSKSSTQKLFMSIGIILGIVTLFGMLVLFRARRRKNVLPENAPIFLVPKGELNHTSELLCARTEESNSPRVSDDEEADHLNDACSAMEDDPEDVNDEYVRAIESALNGEHGEVV